jgi:hypothetical protein
VDFVEGFPRINDKSSILKGVDGFSKFAHFIPLGHPYTATSVVRAFFSDIVRLHGLPSSIVSDRDLVFTSKFWQELFSLTGVKLNLSWAFHPQSDGQSEATNKVIAMYLRCITDDRLRQWLHWLPWRSTATTLPFSRRCGQRRSMWSTATTRRHSSSTPPVRAYRWSISSCKTGTNSCFRFGSVWSSPSSSTRVTTITSTVMCSSRRANGSGFVSCTGR